MWHCQHTIASLYILPQSHDLYFSSDMSDIVLNSTEVLLTSNMGQMEIFSCSTGRYKYEEEYNRNTEVLGNTKNKDS